MGDVAHAIGRLPGAPATGCSPITAGTASAGEMHESPSVPNDGELAPVMRLHTGLVIALEPMLIAGGGDDYRSTPTAGRSVPPTAPAPPTPSTPWRSPSTARASSRCRSERAPRSLRYCPTEWASTSRLDR